MEYKVKIVGVRIEGSSAVVSFYRQGETEKMEHTISLTLWPKIAPEFYVGRECIEFQRISNGIIECGLKLV